MHKHKTLPNFLLTMAKLCSFCACSKSASIECGFLIDEISCQPNHLFDITGSFRPTTGLSPTGHLSIKVAVVTISTGFYSFSETMMFSLHYKVFILNEYCLLLLVYMIHVFSCLFFQADPNLRFEIEIQVLQKNVYKHHMYWYRLMLLYTKL